MTNDPASTVLTGRSKGYDRTFKAIEYMRLSSHDHVKGLIVFITTYFTLCHAQHSFLVALSSSFSPHHGQYDTWLIPVFGEVLKTTDLSAMLLPKML
jgi:hypothetical protein